jgi:hypothetical protein
MNTHGKEEMNILGFYTTRKSIKLVQFESISASVVLFARLDVKSKASN